MRKTKGFSYDPEKDRDIIRHIDSQQNGSQYIWSLVRQDMKSNNIEEIVRQQIERYLQNFSVYAVNGQSSIHNPIIDSNEISNILNL